LVNKASKLLLYLMLLELSIGGGGRFLAIGPISLRMVFFAFAIILFMVQVYRRPKILDRQILVLLLLFTATIGLATLIGYFNDADKKLIFQDIKPLAFFYILPFFHINIRVEDDVKVIRKIIKFSAVFLAISYFMLLFSLHSGIIEFLDFYHAVIASEEFFFRGEVALFYKGFLFLCVGIFFFWREKKSRSAIMLILLVLAMLLTFTRGFILAISLSFMVYYGLIQRRILLLFLYSLIAVFSIFFGTAAFSKISDFIIYLKPDYQTQFMVDESGQPLEGVTVFGNKGYSDEVRISTLEEVVARIDFVSLFIGHGFGIGVPTREIHMEIAYLEIFHKQGLTGLLFWAFLFYLLVRFFREAVKNGYKENALPFFMAAIFVIFQSGVNQYINNPIGMSMVLISLVVLKKFSDRPLKNR